MDAEDWVSATLKRIRPPLFPEAITCSIQEYHGCTGDGVTDCKPAFDSAIRDCFERGGGSVVVPSGGVYFSRGPLHLRSNIQIKVEENATILFSADPNDYLPLVLTRFEGTEVWNYSPLVYAPHCTNVAITGQGTLDGQGSKGFQLFRSHQSRDQALLRQMGASGVPVSQRIFGPGHFLRPSMIQFWNCSSVLVQGITLVDSTFWVLHPVYSTNVIIRDITVDSPFINSDGTDPDSCTDVLIENNTYVTGDDCISIKSGRDEDGWRVHRPSSHIIIRNIHCHTPTNAFCIGSELSGGVHHVHAKHIAIDSAEMALHFKSNRDRGGVVSNITIQNVVATKTDVYLRFTNQYHSWRGGNYPTVFESVQLLNSYGSFVQDAGIWIMGLGGTHIRHVLVSNLTLDWVENSQEIVVVECTDDLVLQHVQINGKWIQMDNTTTFPCTSPFPDQDHNKNGLIAIAMSLLFVLLMLWKLGLLRIHHPNERIMRLYTNPRIL